MNQSINEQVVLSVGAWAGKEYGGALEALGLQLSVERRVIHWFKPTTRTRTQTVEVENDSDNDNADDDDPCEQPRHKARRQPTTTPPQEVEPTLVDGETASSTSESLFSDLPVYMLAPRLRKIKIKSIAGNGNAGNGKSGKEEGVAAAEAERNEEHEGEEDEEEAEEEEVYGFPLQDPSEGVKVR